MEQSNRYWSTTFHHKYPWQTIACAYWKKYPNPESNHVYSEDMIDVQVIFNTKLILLKVLLNKKFYKYSR